jgi:hypothetical protein
VGAAERGRGRRGEERRRRHATTSNDDEHTNDTSAQQQQRKRVAAAAKRRAVSASGRCSTVHCTHMAVNTASASVTYRELINSCCHRAVCDPSAVRFPSPASGRVQCSCVHSTHSLLRCGHHPALISD